MANIQERISKDGKTSYRVQVRLKGFPAQSATFSRKTDARRWGQQTEASILEGRFFVASEAKKHTLSELVDRYIKTIVPQKKKHGIKQASHLNWWKKELGHYLLSDITPALIAEKRDKLLNGITYRGTKRTNATTIRYLSSLSYAFTIADSEWGWITESAVKKVRKPSEGRGRIRFLDTQERKRLLEVCEQSSHPYLLIVVVIAISAGLRYSEIMNLTWGDIDLVKGRIVLHETKNGETRVVPLVGKAYELLKKHQTNRQMDVDLVFPSKKGQKPQKPMGLRSAWQKTLFAAEIKNFTFHDLRHCCASYLAMNGASLTEIAEVLGHKTLQMVKRYSHLSEAHTTSVVKNMNEKIFG